MQSFSHSYDDMNIMLQITIGQGHVSVVVYFPQRLPLGLLCHPYIIDTPPTVVLWVHSVKVFKMYLANQRGRTVQQQISKDHAWLKRLSFLYPRGGCWPVRILNLSPYYWSMLSLSKHLSSLISKEGGMNHLQFHHLAYDSQHKTLRTHSFS